MRNYLFIILLVTAVLQGRTFKNVKFTGDIDRLVGEFDRATLLKICHIEYPAVYKIWKSDPTFEEEQVEEFTDNITEYAHSIGYYHVDVNASTKEDTIVLNI